MDLPEVQDSRKVIQVGSSTGVTLSTDALEAVGLEKGDPVKVVKLTDENQLRIVPADE